MKYFTNKDVLTIEDLHKDLEDSSNDILIKYKKILETPENELDITEAEIEKLKHMGFTSLQFIQEKDRNFTNKSQSKEIVDTVSLFKKEYPQYKFLTFNEAKRISRKYGLVIGDSSLYKLDIPVKNLREILTADTIIKDKHKLLEKENRRQDYYYSQTGISVCKLNFNNSYEPRSGGSSRRYYIANPNIMGPIDHFVTSAEFDGDVFLKMKDPDPVVLYPVYNTSNKNDHYVSANRFLGFGYLVVSVWGEEENIKELKKL